MLPSKILVLDANILIRAVLGKRVRSYIQGYSSRVGFFVPDLCIKEAEQHLPTIFAKRGLPQEPVLEVLARLCKVVHRVEADIYGRYRKQAQRRISIRDPKDWPVVATALALDCPIWTEDSDFFGAGIATWTTDRVALFLCADVDE